MATRPRSHWTKIIYAKHIAVKYASLALAALLLSSQKIEAVRHRVDPIPPYPHFALSADQLHKLLEDLPSETRKKIQTEPLSFLRRIEALLQSDPDLLRTVDKRRSLKADYAPIDLIPLRQFPELSLTRPDLQLREIVLPDLLAMVSAAAREGIELTIGSAYRSYLYQQKVFTYYTEKNGLEAANRFSAKPGESQHQLGTVIDFSPINQSFAETEASRWLLRNAGRYGFSLSYPEGKESDTGYIYEPWHYRYLGKDFYRLQSEFFDNSQQKCLEFWNQYESAFRKLYLI